MKNFRNLLLLILLFVGIHQINAIDVDVGNDDPTEFVQQNPSFDAVAINVVILDNVIDINTRMNDPGYIQPLEGLKENSIVNIQQMTIVCDAYAETLNAKYIQAQMNLSLFYTEKQT